MWRARYLPSLIALLLLFEWFLTPKNKVLLHTCIQIEYPCVSWRCQIIHVHCILAYIVSGCVHACVCVHLRVCNLSRLCMAVSHGTWKSVDVFFLITYCTYHSV